MTTEDDFQRALDAHPDDWQTRLVFADWLQDHDDPRAEGYRALGVRRNQSDIDKKCFWWGNLAKWKSAGGAYPFPKACHLPEDWLSAVDSDGGEDATWKLFDTRREAEDAAALAFAKLPVVRRAELLTCSV